MFKRDFKTKGSIPLSTYLKIYRVGDIVDIKANAAQQKGMPHKYYHGRTGIVYNVTPSSVGVIVYKVVGNRYMEKRVNLRIEHVKHSKCRDGPSSLFCSRVHARERLTDARRAAPRPQTSSTASSPTPRRRRRPRPRASTSSSSASPSRRASRAPCRPRTTRRKPLRPSRTTRPSKRAPRRSLGGSCGGRWLCSRTRAGLECRSGRPDLSSV